jgi:hypothetical protein
VKAPVQQGEKTAEGFQAQWVPNIRSPEAGERLGNVEHLILILARELPADVSVQLCS